MTRKTINVIPNRGSLYIVILRGGKVRRYRKPTPASLSRVRCIVRRGQHKQAEASRG